MAKEGNNMYDENNVLNLEFLMWQISNFTLTATFMSSFKQFLDIWADTSIEPSNMSRSTPVTKETDYTFLSLSLCLSFGRISFTTVISA